MRLASLVLLCGVMASTGYARLGETLDQAEARYGLEKQEKQPSMRSKLLEGAREVTFEFQGWRIRCALLQATDGQFYIVREEYSKIWNSAVMKAGGVVQIRDFERDAVFQAEGGSWTFKVLAEGGPNVPTTAANQLLRMSGVSKAWTRDDGAIAHEKYPGSLVFHLPQALKREAELKGLKDQQQRGNAQRLVQPESPPPTQRLVAPSSGGTSFKTLPYLKAGESPSDPPKPTGNTKDTPIVQRPHPLSALVPFVTLLGLGGLVIFIAKLAVSQSGRPKSARTAPPPPPPQSTTPSTPPPTPSAPAKPRTVKDLDWDEFELLVGEIYRRQGFTAELSAGTGADGGIDLVLHRGEERVLVQCKAWNVYKVSAPAIREFYGVLVSEKADRGFFVTTGVFTRDASAFADGKPIEMIDGPAFDRLLREASAGPNDDLLNVSLWARAFLAASKVTRPDCPFCKTPMVKREGPTGLFWGCPKYPRCRGKREMRKFAEAFVAA